MTVPASSVPPSPPLGPGEFRFEAGGMLGSSPALASDGRILFGSRDRRFYCVDGEGVKRFVVLTDSTCDATPCLAPDGTAFLAGHDGVGRAVDREGRLRWAIDLGGASVVTPALHPRGLVLFASDSPHLMAVDPETGLERWRCPLPGLPWGAPSVDEKGTIYLSCEEVVAIAPDGVLKWRFSTQEPCVAPPSPGPDGRVVVGSWDRSVHALERETGKSMAKAELDFQVYGGGAIDEKGNVYVGTRGGFLHALDSRLRTLWKTEVKDGIYGTPALTQHGAVLFASDDGGVYVADMNTGAIRQRLATGRAVRSSVLLLPDGRVAACSWDFSLHVFTGAWGGPRQCPWPQFQGNPSRTGCVGPLSGFPPPAPSTSPEVP